MIRHTGPTLSAFNAWVLLKGLETMDVRVRRQTDTAAALADLIAAPRRRVVAHPLPPAAPDHPQHAVAARQMSGFSSLVAFDLGSQRGGVPLPQRAPRSWSI